MNLDKKTIFAFLLIGVVFIFVQSSFYQKTFFPEAYKQREMEKNKPPVIKAVEDTVAAPETNDLPVIATAAPANPEPVNSLWKGRDGVVFKEISVETDLYHASFSSKGAILQSWTLKKYKKSDGSLVNMIPEEAQGNYGIQFVTREGDSVDTGSWSFETDAQSEYRLSREQQVLRFVYPIDANRSLIKEFTLHNDSYAIDLTVTLENMGSVIANKTYLISMPSGLASTEKKLDEDMYYAKVAVAASGQVTKIEKAKAEIQKETGSIDWVALRTKYFTHVVIPRSQQGQYVLVNGSERAIPEKKNQKLKMFSVSLAMPLIRETTVDHYTLFLGPMDDDLLKSFGVGLEQIMDMGAKIIRPFSIATLWMFKKIHTVVSNYGLVLIIFALIIKVITLPLTNKSFHSMKKMQALAPKMTELKEKYAKDPERLNKETMKLYKEEGVNPMGGCLPILLQMPLLWALYIVFRSTIELRLQGFFWWIKDLSGPDTIFTLPFSIPLYGDSVNVLPILMGATMILQQKMSITDPKQKAMVYIMPVFMMLLFNGFPSGLNLYYTLFNVISIVHQKYFVADTGSVSLSAGKTGTK